MTAWDYTVVVSAAVAVLALVGLFLLDRPRKDEPPAVPVSPELLEQYRGEIVWNAMQKPKQKLRAGQSRRPL
jgi:hypothetical protein